METGVSVMGRATVAGIAAEVTEVKTRVAVVEEWRKSVNGDIGEIRNDVKEIRRTVEGFSGRFAAFFAAVAASCVLLAIGILVKMLGG
ncbi:MAG: hypothetical protein C4551_02290 [Bacillota bacterium]|nr:MAG: hypothetical protein C4551_02290 [Bacillota bacterium]